MEILLLVSILAVRIFEFPQGYTTVVLALSHSVLHVVLSVLPRLKQMNRIFRAATWGLLYAGTPQGDCS